MRGFAGSLRIPLQRRPGRGGVETKEAEMNTDPNRTAALTAAALLALALAVPGSADAADPRRTVEVALSGPSLQLDFVAPPSARGAHFIVEGVIYPAGTLDHCESLGDSCGWIVNADGGLEPEFPDRVIGSFTCSGWILSAEVWDEGFPALLAGLASGDFTDFQAVLEAHRGEPSVRVTQTYDFAYGDRPGQHLLVTEGFELFSLPGDSVERPVTGGTGIFSNVKGPSTLTSISMVNGSGGSSIAVTFPTAVWD